MHTRYVPYYRTEIVEHYLVCGFKKKQESILASDADFNKQVISNKQFCLLAVSSWTICLFGKMVLKNKATRFNLNLSMNVWSQQRVKYNNFILNSVSPWMFDNKFGLLQSILKLQTKTEIGLFNSFLSKT